MGVTGLWPILAPSARPTPLATLNRKRLAVDASIWIYQFLKAVRDKEGNALRNSHVVGFFRRICKLLYFGIKPVFVFDGGAPVLKRQTILGRKRRREGRREDAVRTAGKLLAVQMKRRGEEEEEKRRKQKKREKEGLVIHHDEEEAIPEDRELVYVGEMGMSAQERSQNRKFRKTDAYHLPELTNGIEGMGQPDDPRIMSTAELEEYAKQFNDGEDINMYDFSKIDFESEFFKTLPAGDRYNILNAARLRSRLRMGVSKEHLDARFSDRMEFSRFQIARVMERNELTQRLMNLNGMNEMAGVGGGRIAGERGREYVLVKNDGVEGGWALGVVSEGKSAGRRDAPIDVDALGVKVEEIEESEEEEFEDVPVEGLNRLPKLSGPKTTGRGHPENVGGGLGGNGYRPGTGEFWREVRGDSEQEDSLFVDQDPIEGSSKNVGLFVEDDDDDLNKAIAMSLQKDGEDVESEEEHVRQAIALSLKNNHRQESEQEEDIDFEDVPMPEFKQRAVEAPKPIANANYSGGMIAHMVNNRANAAVPKPRAVSIDSDSDNEMDLQAALAKARKQKAPVRRPAPVVMNNKNPFDGPLPFEKLNFGPSLFKKSKPVEKSAADSLPEDDDMAGGFDNIIEEEAPKPLPPWLADGNDITDQVKQQRRREQEINHEDEERAAEEKRLYMKNHAPIEIDSSDGEDDFEIVEPPAKKVVETIDESPLTMVEDTPGPSAENDIETFGDIAEDVRAVPPVSNISNDRQPSPEAVIEDKDQTPAHEDEEVEWSESDYGGATRAPTKNAGPLGEIADSSQAKSASPEFEDVEIPTTKSATPMRTPSPIFEDVDMPDQAAAFPSEPPSSSQALADDEAFNRQLDAEFDDFDDPEDEELMTRLAEEAEQYAEFANTLNHKTQRQTEEEYDRELKALRNQQKKDRRDADEVTQVMITECQNLLRLFGLPYITAPMEAEAQCAELVNLGLVDGVVTDDCDVFLFGGTRVYKNFFNSNKNVECYLASDIEKELSVSRDQMIAIAHLLGSDYTEGIPGIGPVTAVEIISEFPSANGLEEFRDWFLAAQTNAHPISSEPSTFRKKFRRAQSTKIFLPTMFPSSAVTEAYLKPEVDSTTEPFQWGVPDLDRLRDFLMATIGWTQERTDEVLVPVIRDMNQRAQEGTQSNITRYFDGAVGVGAVGAPVGKERAASKRMREAVGKLKARKKDDPLGRTFADEARTWAEKNDIGWTEKEREKHERKGRKRKAKEKEKEVVDEQREEDEEEEVDDAEEDEELGEEEAPPKKKSSKGKAVAKRKRAKV